MKINTGVFVILYLTCLWVIEINSQQTTIINVGGVSDSASPTTTNTLLLESIQNFSITFRLRAFTITDNNALVTGASICLFNCNTSFCDMIEGSNQFQNHSFSLFNPYSGTYISLGSPKIQTTINENALNCWILSNVALIGLVIKNQTESDITIFVSAPVNIYDVDANNNSNNYTTTSTKSYYKSVQAEYAAKPILILTIKSYPYYNPPTPQPTPIQTTQTPTYVQTTSPMRPLNNNTNTSVVVAENIEQTSNTALTPTMTTILTIGGLLLGCICIIIILFLFIRYQFKCLKMRVRSRTISMPNLVLEEKAEKIHHSKDSQEAITTTPDNQQYARIILVSKEVAEMSRNQHEYDNFPKAQHQYQEFSPKPEEPKERTISNPYAYNEKSTNESYSVDKANDPLEISLPDDAESEKQQQQQ